MSFHGVPPNPTIYVKNLNDKIKKPAMRQNLYLFFSQFGNVLELHHYQTNKLRGQAWIVFDSLGGATKAIRDGQDLELFGKNLRLSYARSKSDTIAKMDGTYRPKRRDKQSNMAAAIQQTKQITQQAVKKRPAPVREDRGANRAVRKELESAPANRILFVENLPDYCSTMMLAILFQQYDGYKEARLVNGKPGIAFVEFGDIEQAHQAKESLQGFKITPQNLMKITFARQ